jgi:hypothetical protein
MLLLGGFVSYGAAAVIIVGAIAAISTASTSRVILTVAFATFLGLSVFVNYYAHRTEIRDAVWGGAPMEQRVDATFNIFRDFAWLDSTNSHHLIALHERLNQNYFVGIAAERIRQGQTSYLYGRSIWEGILALVPRAIWPEKPVFVGNVMEFHINFGIPGLVLGFLVLGWLLGFLDRKAAESDRSGEFGKVFFYFLPAAALIQPIGSMVELAGGGAAALVAAYGWSWTWERWSKRRVRSAKLPAKHL